MRFKKSLNLLICFLLVFSICFNVKAYAISPSTNYTTLAWDTGSYDSVDDSSSSGWGTGSYDSNYDSSTSGWGTGSYNSSSGSSSSSSSSSSKYDDYDYDYDYYDRDYDPEDISAIGRLIVTILSLLPEPIRSIVVYSFIAYLIYSGIKESIINNKKNKKK